MAGTQSVTLSVLAETGEVVPLRVDDAGNLVATAPTVGDGTQWQYSSATEAAATSAVTLVAGSPGVRHTLAALQITNGSGLGAPVITVTSGASTLWKARIDQSEGQLVVAFPVPLRGEPGEALSLQASSGGELLINAQGRCV